MDASIFKMLGQFAGIGGVALGVMLFVLRDVIKKNIFPKFKNEKNAYRLLRLIVISVWTVALVGVAAWVIIAVFASKGPDTVAITNNVVAGDLNLSSYKVIINQVEQTGASTDTIRKEIQRGMNLVKGELFKDAIPIFEKLAKQTNVSAVHNNLGVLYTMMNQLTAARASFTDAIAEDPESQAAHVNIGFLDHKAGNPEAALRHFQKAPDAVAAVEQINAIRGEPTPKNSGTSSGLIASGVEQEPNNIADEASALVIGTAVSGGFSSGDQRDFFRIRNTSGKRDYVKIAFDNASTTLAPNIKVYNWQKSFMFQKYDGTTGSDYNFKFVTEIDWDYYLEVLRYKGDGAYRLSVVLLKAFDQFEPNNDAKNATLFRTGRTLDAGILDSRDNDWYEVSGLSSSRLTVRFVHVSGGLAPNIKVYNQQQSFVTQKYDGTSGASLTFTIDVDPSQVYYLQVLHYKGTGSYRLTVKSS